MSGQSMIPNKRKICSECQAPQFLFSGGMCRYCWGKAQLKPPIRPSQPRVDRRSTFRRIKVSLKGKKPVKHVYWGYTSQIDMFFALWEKMKEPRVCPISGKKLDGLVGTSRWVWCFAHILPKGKYILYKLNPENILVVHPDIHVLLDQGTEDQRKETGLDFDVFYNMQEKLKKEYEIFAKEH